MDRMNSMLNGMHLTVKFHYALRSYDSIITGRPLYLLIKCQLIKKYLTQKEILNYIFMRYYIIYCSMLCLENKTIFKRGFIIFRSNYAFFYTFSNEIKNNKIN